MIYKKLLIALLAGWTIGNPLAAQNPATDTVYRFTLAEAQQFALENSPAVKNSTLDVDIAKQKVWETTTIGLPQVSLGGTLTYDIVQSELIKSFSDLGALFGDTTSSSNSKNTDLNISADLTVSQLIFNGSYIVGLQTSKIYKTLSETSLKRSKSAIEETIKNSYFLILITTENKKLFTATYNNTLKIFDETKAAYNEGLIDEVTIDQLKINVNSLKNVCSLLERQVEVAQKLLKFQMGLGVYDTIELSDSLSYLMAFAKMDSLPEDLNIDNNIDFQLALTQEKLMKMNLRLQYSNALPSISAFYQYHKQLNDDYPDFQPIAMAGVKLSLPLFGSGQNYSKIKQAKFEYIKAQNNRANASEGLKLEYETARVDYINALDKYTLEADNLSTAKKIYQKSLAMFKEGVISGTDLTQAQNQLYTIQTNYFNAILETVTAKSKLERLLTAN